MPVTLDLHKIGVELRFNAKSQRLELVRVYDVSKQDYSYSGKGLTFVFTIPDEIKTSKQIIDRKMPEFDAVTLKTIYVFVSNDEEPHKMQPIAAVDAPSPIFIANLAQGVSFRGEKSIVFGASVQDVLSILGRPSLISYKNESVLSIHGLAATGKSGASGSAQPDYFYNYFNFGLDVLFDGCAHVVKKFVLRTNLPTNALFDLYRKCHFQLVPPKKVKEEKARMKGKEKEGKRNGDENDKNDDDDDDDEGDYDLQVKTIAPEMKWRQIREIFGPNHAEPYLLPPTKENPFGGSRFYAYQDVIFEVSMDTEHLSSVTLFRSAQSDALAR